MNLRATLRRVLRRFVDEAYEGPLPPSRLQNMAETWLQENPRATRQEWFDFVVNVAGEAYKSGYIRGYDDSARLDLGIGPSPEEVADAIDPNWRNPDRGIVLSDMTQPVPEAWTEAELTLASVQDARIVAAARRM